MSKSPHPTTRRGFIATLGFGGISLYGLWAAYGAAPGPLALLRPTALDGAANAMGPAGHGMAPTGPSADVFRAQVAEFVRRFATPDGSVYPRPDTAMAMAPTAQGATPVGQLDHAAHGFGVSIPNMSVQAATGAPHIIHGAQTDGQEQPHDAPVDVYLLAERYFYEPDQLRLDVGRPYRFRLMAADVPHGASIQFGRGARMIRLQSNVVTELDLTFEQKGGFLVYCTAYCGLGHDVMQARIDVV